MEYYVAAATVVTTATAIATYLYLRTPNGKAFKTTIKTLGIRGIAEMVYTMARFKLLKRLGVGIIERSSKGKDLFEISYYDGTKKCSILIKKERGPNKITKVVASDDATVASIEDVTEEVLNYAGPSKNFYGTDLKPSHLVQGKKSLSFHYRDGKVRRFNHDQDIVLV